MLLVDAWQMSADDHQLCHVLTVGKPQIKMKIDVHILLVVHCLYTTEAQRSVCLCWQRYAFTEHIKQLAIQEDLSALC
jgi:hypothetical protein